MNITGLDRLIDSLPSVGFPMVRVIITKDGKTVYTRSSGFADADKTRRPTADDLYRIYSVSKVCTCTAAMQLVEQGKLGLYDDVAKYIPAFGDMKIQDRNGIRRAENSMKIWHLFTMTGGMDYDLASDGIKRVLAANPHAGTVELCTAMAEKPLFFEPGTRYKYSLCHDVLAAVVEIVSGERFADYCQNHIFEPLGMKDTTFHPTKEQEKRICSLYSFHNWDGTSAERKNV
ncbi:MAG: beta-lactamase family protein, partial [Clostridia bacterium]|nr:beta-lactamase family protein [Clostridia bacterium]